MGNLIPGILGSVMLIVGIFLPVVSGPNEDGEIVNYSYFTTLKGGRFSLGILCAVLGLISLALVFTGKYKRLTITGALSLAIVALEYFVTRSQLAEHPEAMLVWIGWMVLALGGVLVLLAGLMKSKGLTPAAPWSSAPPPPPPSTPGR